MKLFIATYSLTICDLIDVNYILLPNKIGVIFSKRKTVTIESNLQINYHVIFWATKNILGIDVASMQFNYIEQIYRILSENPYLLIKIIFELCKNQDAWCSWIEKKNAHLTDNICMSILAQHF